MSEEILNEISGELRKQNIMLNKIHRSQKEATWYLWLIAVIMVVSVVVPFVLLAVGSSSR